METNSRLTQKIQLKPGELTAYSILIAGFLTLVVLLRTDFGTALFDKERLFYVVPASVPTPILQVELDEWGGERILRLHTENFRFANYCKVPETEQPLSGHAHLYIDGRKVMSVYEPVMFLPKLPTGKYRLTISLNILPDHRAIMVEGKPVSVDMDISGFD
uniref:Uncharacterized protein n=1 Tax=uncultured Thiotrichaceae bacterium TaxID=298394 RepID=A0A6S6UP24_9GAMM|nr:MAG: Unknown protein [uncultured Thiotrichaceae bacterium]